MKMIQIRNVPDDVHRALKSRASARGTTMSELIGQELPRIARQVDLEETFARIDERGPIKTDRSGSDLVREARDTR